MPSHTFSHRVSPFLVGTWMDSKGFRDDEGFREAFIQRRKQTTEMVMWLVVLQKISQKKIHSVKAVWRFDSIELEQVTKILKTKY